MQKSVKYMAIGLVVLGICLAWVALMFSNDKASPSSKRAAAPEVASQVMQYAVVVRHGVERGHFLTAEDVELREVPQIGVRGFTEVSQVVGRGVVDPVAAGAMLQLSHLLSGISGTLQSGERAVSIKVDEATAVGHKLQPGDWVDVLVVLRKDGQEVGQTQARRILERKRVLAYGTLTDAQVAHGAGPKEKTSSNSKGDSVQDPVAQAQQARTAVLVVGAHEVNALLLAERQGQVMLALRSPLEAVSVEATTTALQPTAPEVKLAGVAAAPESVVTLSQLAPEQRPASSSSPSSRLAPSMAPVVRATAVRPPVLVPQGMAVEVIRGNRSETVHY